MDYDTLFATVAAKREAAGLNVHFINECGEPDCYSFAKPERRDAFIAQLRRAGRTIL